MRERGSRLHFGVTKMADDDRPEAKLPQALEKDFLTEKCSGRPSVEDFYHEGNKWRLSPTR